MNIFDKFRSKVVLPSSGESSSADKKPAKGDAAAGMDQEQIKKDLIQEMRDKQGSSSSTSGAPKPPERIQKSADIVEKTTAQTSAAVKNFPIAAKSGPSNVTVPQQGKLEPARISDEEVVRIADQYMPQLTQAIKNGDGNEMVRILTKLPPHTDKMVKEKIIEKGKAILKPILIAKQQETHKAQTEKVEAEVSIEGWQEERNNNLRDTKKLVEIDRTLKLWDDELTKLTEEQQETIQELNKFVRMNVYLNEFDTK